MSTKASKFSICILCQCGRTKGYGLERKGKTAECECGRKYKLSITKDNCKTIGERGPLPRFIRGNVEVVPV